MRIDLKTTLFAILAATAFGCDDGDDTGGAGGGDTDMMVGEGGMGGDGEGGMGGDGEGGAGGEAGMGGEGGGEAPTCESECGRLADCSAQSDSCPGITPEGRDAFYDGCLEACAGNPALVALASSQAECEGLIATLSNVNADYAASCEDTGMGGEGGEGGMGGEGGEGGMGGEGGSHVPEGEQIDRMGRAAVSTALIGADDKDAYNQSGDPSTWEEQWGAALTAGLEFADSLDGEAGNSLLPPAALGPVLATDVLLVDASKPYAADGYLTVELALVGIIPEGTSGGRSLTQNVIDLTLSAVVGTPLDSNWDCVDANDVPFEEGFPYLAPPHMGE